MVKKHTVGRSLVKKHDVSTEKSDRHTTTTTKDFSRLPIHSITEETNLSEFFNIAELANSDFTTQKTFRVLSPTELAGVSTHIQCNDLEKVHRAKRDLLKIPRRPRWDRTMCAGELNNLEKEEFLNWRRSLSTLEQKDVLVLTPFEKNIELWRQLWRVVERCDVLVQIVDARQPMLYYCQDLERYAREVDANKVCLVLVNKSDLLSVEQRAAWGTYFNDLNVWAIFFSATMVELSCNRRTTTSDILSTTNRSINITSIEEESTETFESSNPISNSKVVPPMSNSVTDPVHDESLHESNTKRPSTPTRSGHHLQLLSAEEFLDLLASDVYPLDKPRIDATHLTVGFIGYPNVGKSSTMNALMGYKKTAVSSTPGKTKHFQTLQVRPDLMLCDCPGLVLPSFSYSKSDLILAGILSIDEMRDYLSPIGLLCERIPRSALEFKYGINLSHRNPENPDFDHQSSPTPHQLLAAHAFAHGFRTAKGNPHYDRSARLILKDYVQGRLLYNHPPPNFEPHTFQHLGRDCKCSFPSLMYSNLAKPFPKNIPIEQSCLPATCDKTKKDLSIADSSLITAFDRMAFQKMDLTDSHIRCRKTLTIENSNTSADADDDTYSISSWITTGSTSNGSASISIVGTNNCSVNTASKKPWRQMSNMKRTVGHRKRNDKLRRVYAQLDEHELT